MYIFSIVIVVVSNMIYHVCQKSAPQNANPFTALFAAYLTAIFMSFIAFYCYKTDESFIQSFKHLNWTSIVLGLSIVGLELGYFLAYRAGWNLSTGSLVANITLAVLLVPIGIIFFKESFDLTKVLGAIFCIIGFFLINK